MQNPATDIFERYLFFLRDDFTPAGRNFWLEREALPPDQCIGTPDRKVLQNLPGSIRRPIVERHYFTTLANKIEHSLFNDVLLVEAGHDCDRRTDATRGVVI